jgi:uncharacterized repeat protein (TIGR01451 family)
MNMPRAFVIGLLAALLPSSARAQLPCPPPVRPSVPAPLLFVRIGGPPGLQAAFYETGAAGRGGPAPFAVGLRPGYCYQFELTGLPARPERPDAVRALYPSVEVRGSLSLNHGLKPADHPVPLVFSREDIARAQDGAFIMKVFYLECPEEALAVATKPDQPLEIEVPPSTDPVAEARARGRLVLILRFGERQLSPAEVASHSVPGTVLFPGETALGPPTQPPCVPWACWQVTDPRLGARLLEEECFHDGGDIGRRAGIGPDGRLHGLDPSDTVAEYSDSTGGRHVSVSNRVCICAPRFAAIRSELTPAGYVGVKLVARTETVTGRIIYENRVPVVEAHRVETPENMIAGAKASELAETQGVGVVEQYIGMVIAIGRVQTGEMVGSCFKELLLPQRPLVLCKSADRHTAQVGDVVTFQIRYTNSGGQPISDVAVSDSLTNRLEYVPGSARSDREAVFTTQANEAGSVILRWEFGGRLLANQSGVVNFQARVR